MALSAQKQTMTAEEFHPKTLDSKLKKEDGNRDSHSDIEGFGELIAAERENEIKYRTCSWQKVGTSMSVCIIYRLTVTCHLPKTAALLFSEYICLAILSFPWYVGWSTQSNLFSYAAKVVFRAWIGSWCARYPCGCRNSVVHITSPLALLSSAPRYPGCLRYWPEVILGISRRL